MTSLYPGTIFNASGLNKKSTPSKPNVTKDQLNSKFRRQSYNHGRVWPKESPVAGVYDISNSSTSLIIINNRQHRGSKLRGQNDPKKEGDRIPNPERHSRFGTPVNRNFHSNCYNSQSPYFSPTVSANLEWANYTQRPPGKFYDGSPVNPKRHTSCRVPADPAAFQSGMVSEFQRRPYSHITLPSRIKATPLLEHPELSAGEKQYLANIARVYSANQMMKLKQDQYNKLLLNEMSKGLYNKDEIDQYRKFINIGRRRQYLSPPTVFRTTSAPPPHNDYSYDEDSDEKLKSDSSSQTARSSSSEKSINNSRQLRPRTQSRTKPVNNRSKSVTNVPLRSMSPELRSKSPANKPKSQPVQSKSPGTRSKSPESSIKSRPQRIIQNKKEKQEETAKNSGSSSSSDETELPSTNTSLHREGYDRPKSRLGHLSPRNEDRSRSEMNNNNKAPPPSPINIPSSNIMTTFESETSEPRERNDNSADSNTNKVSNPEDKREKSLSSDEAINETKETQKSSMTNEQTEKYESSGLQKQAEEKYESPKSETQVDKKKEISSSEDEKQVENSKSELVGNKEKSNLDKLTESKRDNSVSKSDEQHDSSVSESVTYSSKTKTASSDEKNTSQTEDKNSSQSEDNNISLEKSDSDHYTSSFPTYTGSTLEEKSTPQPSNSEEKYSSSAENPTSQTTTEYSRTEDQSADDKIQRQDSLEEISIDNPRHVNKDIDAIEY